MRRRRISRMPDGGTSSDGAVVPRTADGMLCAKAADGALESSDSDAAQQRSASACVTTPAAASEVAGSCMAQPPPSAQHAIRASAVLCQPWQIVPAWRATKASAASTAAAGRINRTKLG